MKLMSKVATYLAEGEHDTYIGCVVESEAENPARLDGVAAEVLWSVFVLAPSGPEKIVDTQLGLPDLPVPVLVHSVVGFVRGRASGSAVSVEDALSQIEAAVANEEAISGTLKGDLPEEPESSGGSEEDES